MVREFWHNGQKYQYIKFEELELSDLPNGERKDVRKVWYSASKKIEYIDLGCGFDIETTKIPYTDLSTMYVWQFSLNSVTIIGRTWEEFNKLRKIISDYYSLGNKRRLLCYVHNLKYEFSFMKNQVKWYYNPVKERPEIFAVDDRETIKALSNEFIEFRDSLILTQLKLEKVAEDYDLGLIKLKGDLDYSKARNSLTKLSNEEIAYCINDVQILSAFYNKYIYKEFVANNKAIPLTLTGIVRQELKDAFKNLSSEEKRKYKNFMVHCMPNDKCIYDIMVKNLFRGGYVHANLPYTNRLLTYDYMGSQDFKSCYPAVLLQEKFPYNFVQKDPQYFYSYINDKEWLEEHAFFGLFKIKNIKRRFSHSLESKDKILEMSDNAKFDNGRLCEAEWITVYLTEQDVLNYLDLYDIDLSDIECEFLCTSKKEELPKFMKDLILKYYCLKETTPKGTVEYVIAKMRLNAIYGMCVSALIYADIKYDTASGQFIPGGMDKKYDKAKRDIILLPQWGIWCSAFSRRRLIKNVAKLGNDAFYCDTDCIKYKGEYNNHIFEEFNAEIDKINSTMYVGEYDRALFKDLGKFDFEGRISKFKTLGCKCYIYTDMEDNTTVKVSGLPKGALNRYCEKNGIDIYDIFDKSLILNETESCKKETKYMDKPFSVELTDYQGNTKMIEENSCSTLCQIPFSFSGVYELGALVTTVENAIKMRDRSYV